MEVYKPFDKCQSLIEVSTAMVKFVKRTGKSVKTKFNQHKLTAKPGIAEKDIIKRFRCQAQRAEHKSEEAYRKYRNTKTGKAEAQKERSRKEQAIKAKEEGILPFVAKDPEAWSVFVNSSEDPWHKGMTRFISRWMNIMERKMSQGRAMKDIIDESAQEADIENIDRMCYTGKFVSKFWIHGKEFGRWNTIID